MIMDYFINVIYYFMKKNNKISLVVKIQIIQSNMENYEIIKPEIG